MTLHIDSPSKGSVTLSLPYLPQSYNRTAHAHWRKVHAAKQQLQADLEVLLMEARVPRPIPTGGGAVRASAVLIVPDRRRRDDVNWRTPLEKALGDALTNGGFLPDDTPEFFRFGSVTFAVQPGVRRSLIRLWWRP